jgi:hypothetical protein
MDDLPSIEKKQLCGNESFINGPNPIGFSLFEFWRWGFSDIVNNATRGALAEFIVAHALGCKTNVRQTWEPFDLETPDKVTIEVKSAAYIQSWGQQCFSTIQFNCPETVGWDSQSNIYQTIKHRQALIYVFALLKHRDQNTLNPLDVSQWEFYVVPTKILNEKINSQKSITPKKLRDISVEPVSFEQLKNVVQNISTLLD